MEINNMKKCDMKIKKENCVNNAETTMTFDNMDIDVDVCNKCFKRIISNIQFEAVNVTV